MTIYNISLTIFFWTLFNVIITEIKTIYSFSNLSFNSYILLLLSILLLSMAGVPPFIGFFSKLFLFNILINSSFFILYSLFLVVLFLGLYFYIQNLRFLHSTNKNTLNHPFLYNEKTNILFYYITVLTIYFLIFGFFFIDDMLLYFSWMM